MKKVILGGVLGGLVLFFWGAVSHMATPLGAIGVRSIPPAQEAGILDAMRGAMNERAIYFFPGLDPSRVMAPEEQQAYAAKYRAGPAGIVIYNPRPGGDPLSARQLLTELGSNVLAALVAALVLVFLAGPSSYGQRVFLVASFGLVAGLEVDVSYWNWYGSPTNYVLAQLVDHTTGWLLAGLVVARVCRR